MSTVQKEIVAEFHAKLLKTGLLDKSMADAVRDAIGSGQKPKADDVAALLEKAPTVKQP